MVMVRGVWHSPQWATARTRYSPLGTPAVGAAAGGVSRGANAASHAGRNTDSNSGTVRSEEHTSELQSRPHLVCRLLLEKKKSYIIEFRDACPLHCYHHVAFADRHGE